MRGLFVIAALAIAQTSADWTGSGRLQCYGHLFTDVTTPPGGGYLEHGKVTCSPAEWAYPQQDLGPEAMFFAPSSGPEFEIWAWDYHSPNIPTAECVGDIWYKTDDMGAGYCVPNFSEKGFNGCGYASCVGDIVCHGC